LLIQQRRIRNLDRHLPAEFRGKKLHIGVMANEHNAPRLKKIGFSDLALGEYVLPGIVGPISRFNAEGKEVKRRDLPMETAYRQILWTWIEHHGPNEVEQTGIKQVPYQRYPREFVAPPSIELEVVTLDSDEKAVVSPGMVFEQTSEERLLHTINLMLEIFGECLVLSEDLKAVLRAPIKRLHWKLLPPGKHPWEKLQSELEPLIQRARQGNRKLISHRLALVNQLKPEFVAVGTAGFTGYVVFGFPTKNRFIFESCLYGNATYVFDKDWEELSKWTKAEILTQNRQRARIIHLESWEAKLRRQIPQ
jgi:hypothetical protein